MFQRFHEKLKDREEGFTLIELLVVVLIIAILAAIAIPVFLRQREKAYVADIQSLVRNGATAVESFAATNGGDYTGAGTSDDWNDLRVSTTQTKAVDVSTTHYCVEATDSRLSAGHDWATAHFFSGDGKPAEGACPALP
jgi:type IV pilus assembly protein PilA